MTSTVVGIDVAKAKLDIALLQDEAMQYATFDNTQSGFRALKHFLEKRHANQAHICLEATGVYGDEIALFLQQAGYPVSVVNPAQIKAFAASRLSRNKTDKQDAYLIALYCQTQRPPLWTPPTPAWLELRAMVRHLAELKAMRQQERNRLKTGAHSLIVMDTLQAHAAFLDEQIANLQKHIQTHIAQHPDLTQQHELLTSIPGISDLTASKLLAEIRDIRDFQSAKQLAAFAGLTPRHHQSGSSIRRHTHISKVGSARLRTALYMPAVSAKQHNPIMRAFAQRLEANGKSPMMIVVAVMRKLLHLVYGILKSGQPFDPHYLEKQAAIA
jgi:transposase